MNNSNNKIEKSLSMALKSELESIQIYQKMMGMVKNKVVKEKLQYLIDDEKKHQKVLIGLFDSLVPDKELSVSNDSRIPWLSIAINEDKTISDLWGLALEAKRTSVRLYDYLSKEFEERRAQEILQYLASMEHSHYFILEGEYRLCLRDMNYVERESFQYHRIKAAE